MGILAIDTMNSQSPVARGKDDRCTATCTPFVNEKRAPCPNGILEVQAKLENYVLLTHFTYLWILQVFHILTCICIIYLHFYSKLQ